MLLFVNLKTAQQKQKEFMWGMSNSIFFNETEKRQLNKPKRKKIFISSYGLKSLL